MGHLLQDLRFGLRLLGKEVGFTAVAVLTLALGIAVNTTVFSWIDNLLLRPFPGASDAHQLAVFEMVTPAAPNGANQLSYLDYRDYKRSMQSLAGLAVHREDVFTLGQGADVQTRWGELVSGNYFEVLGVRAALGRTFTREEDGDETGVHAVAVISDRLWRERFNGARAAVGRTLRVNQRDLTIVGVTPPAFRGTMPGLAFDVWVPVTMGRELGILDAAAFQKRSSRGLYALARLKSGISRERASAEAASVSRNLERAYPDTNTGLMPVVLPVWQFHGAAPDLLLKPLGILMAVSILLLLIVCANVANLLLARSVGRRKEFGIRLAMGARGFRLSRQLLTETLVLAGGGALVGLTLTPWVADLLPALIPNINAPIALDFDLNLRVLAFSTIVCFGCALLAGMVPALIFIRTDVNRSLSANARGGSEGYGSNRARSLLICSEVALACLALVGAGIFLRSFREAKTTHPGFDVSNMVLARFYLAGSGFSTADQQLFCGRLRDRLRSVPGVVDVSYSDYAPLGSSAGPYQRIEVDGYVADPRESMNVNRYIVAPGYFRALRTPLLAGREFNESDDPKSAPVIIVNQTFEKRYFGGGSALGRQVRLGAKAATIVGVAMDSKYFNVAEAPRPHFFAAYGQRGRAGQQLFFFIRTSDRPQSIMARLRREVAAVDQKAAALDVMLLSEWISVTLLPQRVTASLAAALGLISLILAAIGLYSVMAYSVSQRTREIGIRMALGAQPRSVLGNVIRRGLFLTLAGLCAGLAAAFVAMRLVSAVLMSVRATDPVSYAGAAAFLILVGVAASYVPARRAMKIDPITALRCE